MDEILGGDIGKEYSKMEALLREKNKNAKKQENRPDSARNRGKNEEFAIKTAENVANSLNFVENPASFQSLNSENLEKCEFFKFLAVFYEI